MENLSNSGQAPAGGLALPFNGAVRNVGSVNLSARSIAQQMRTLSVSYQDAVHEFRRRYIIEVLITRACHLGKTAQELGMHRNTLARTIAECRIDLKDVRNSSRTYRAGESPEVCT